MILMVRSQSQIKPEINKFYSKATLEQELSHLEIYLRIGIYSNSSDDLNSNRDECSAIWDFWGIRMIYHAVLWGPCLRLSHCVRSPANFRSRIYWDQLKARYGWLLNVSWDNTWNDAPIERPWYISQRLLAWVICIKLSQVFEVKRCPHSITSLHVPRNSTSQSDRCFNWYSYMGS